MQSCDYYVLFRILLIIRMSSIGFVLSFRGEWFFTWVVQVWDSTLRYICVCCGIKWNSTIFFYPALCGCACACGKGDRMIYRGLFGWWNNMTKRLGIGMWIFWLLFLLFLVFWFQRSLPISVDRIYVIGRRGNRRLVFLAACFIMIIGNDRN